jgi:hypothetical protein
MYGDKQCQYQCQCQFPHTGKEDLRQNFGDGRMDLIVSCHCVGAAVLYCTALHCTALCYTALYWTALYNKSLPDKKQLACL